MLLKTLMPCCFRYGWTSRALGTEGPAFWAALVVMATVSWIESSSANCGLFSPKILCTSHFLITREDSRWKWGQWSPGPDPAAVVIWKGREIMLFFFFQWGPLLPPLCFQPRISEIEDLRKRRHKYTENILFYKAHAYAIVLGWFPLFSTDSVVFLSIGKLQTICTSLLRSWDFFYIDDLASNMLPYW